MAHNSKKIISQPKHIVAGTQKNCLNERVLLRTTNVYTGG